MSWVVSGGDDYDHDYRLAQNEIVAQIIKLSYELDLGCIAQQVREVDQWDSFAPVLYPEEWRRDRQAMGATAGVLRAMAAFATACRKVRGPIPEMYRYPDAGNKEKGDD